MACWYHQLIEIECNICLDGALVNPVPVNLCRKLGADFVIAVNLQKNVLVKSFEKHIEPNSLEGMLSTSVFGQVPQTIKEGATSLWEVALR